MGGYDVVVGNVDGECVFWGVEEEKVRAFNIGVIQRGAGNA